MPIFECEVCGAQAGGDARVLVGGYEARLCRVHRNRWHEFINTEMDSQRVRYGFIKVMLKLLMESDFDVSRNILDGWVIEMVNFEKEFFMASLIWIEVERRRAQSTDEHTRRIR